MRRRPYPTEYVVVTGRRGPRRVLAVDGDTFTAWNPTMRVTERFDVADVRRIVPEDEIAR